MPGGERGEHITREYLEELQLRTTAEKLGVTLEEAARRIEKCISQTAYAVGVPPSDVYQAFHSLEYIEECSRKLVKSDPALSEEDCLKSCSTVWFEGRCHPRFFENAQTINEDPDTYAKKLSTNELKDLIRLASYLYYNFEGGGLTDNSFDALEYLLNKREKTKFRRREDKAIGSLPIERLRTKLPYPMGSLEKLKPGMESLLKYLTSPLEWSVKEDGVSALVIFSGGKPQKIYSRGDGTIGGDISFIKDFVKFPTPKEYPDIVVRGELVMKTNVFKEKYSKVYTTPRSMVAAKVNSGYASPWLTDISFVAYQVVDLRSPKDFSKDPFSILRFEGFETASHGVLENPTLFELITLYKEQRNTSDYWIDGLVIQPVNRSLPKVAFKMLLEEQVRWTKVLSIEWRPTRTGKIFPRVKYEAVFVDGRRFTHASGFNAAHIRDWNLRKGCQIKVVISGDIIPVIQDVKEPLDLSIAPQSFSLPPEEPEWEWKGKDIYLVDIEGNPIVQQKRILYFWQALAAKGIGEKAIEKFYQAGYDTIAKIASIPSGHDLHQVLYPGSKSSTSGEKIFKTIHEVLQTARFDRLVPAIGNIKGMGRKLIKGVLKYIPNMFIEPPEDLRAELNRVKIPGVAAKRKEALIEGVPAVINFLKSISSEDFKIAIKNEKERIEYLRNNPKNPRIESHSFVFTGFFGDVDFQLEDYIYDNGGDISSAITSKTAALICKNPAEFSKTIELASQLKVVVLTIPEFIVRFDIPFAVEEELLVEG